MMNFKKLFKIYNLKSWKQTKFQIFLSIIAIAIAVAILISLKLMLALNNSYSNINAKGANDGDINITIATHNIDDDQLKVLKKLTSEGKIQYATTYKMQNNLTSNEMTNVVEVKFIDSQYSYISKRISDKVENLGDGNVIINKAAADKFNLKIGDTISLVLKGISNNQKKYRIEDIIDSTNILDESVFGVIILDKSNLQADETMKIGNLATNINVVINKNYKLEDIKSQLEKSFSKVSSMTTYKQIIETNKNTTDKEKEALEFIEMLVTIITGVGISFTTLLLILKRKKDYILFSIYGMKEDLLRDLILYETFIICVLGIIIGIFLSFIITGFLEKSVIMALDIRTLIEAAVFPIVSTMLFIIVQTMIFTILPIAMSKDINPNTILRQQEKKLSINSSFTSSIFKMIVLITISFSIYIGSLKTGFIYICIVLFLIIFFYGVAIGGITLIGKKKKSKNKFLLLALRNIQRQKNNFALCATALVITLIFCGLIINFSYSIIPNIMKQFVDDSGYSLSLSTDFNVKDINNTEKVLSKEINIDKYIETIETTGNIKSLQGRSLEEYIKLKQYNEESAGIIKESYNNVTVDAIDISKDMLNYDTIMGKWFTKKDINKNYVVLGNDFDFTGISINDKIAFDIQGKTYEFTVIGICPRSNFRDNKSVYIDINSLKDSTSIKDSNSKVQFLIKCDNNKKKELMVSLSKKLQNSLVIDQSIVFKEESKYIVQLTYVFVCICCISIFSSVCVIGNILMIINFERLKEFLMLNVVGAKNRDIRKITIIEGLIIGGVSGIVGSFISEGLSYLIITQIFECRYFSNFMIDLVMIISAIVLTIAASLLVINNMKVEKYSEMLRSE